MAVFYEGVYSIDCHNTNKNYINAIVKYNQKLWIHSIDGKKLDKEIEISQLPSLVKQAKKEGKKSIKFGYRGCETLSLFKAFPKIEASENQKKLASQKCSEASRYLDEIIYYKTKSVDVYYPKSSKKPKSISREEALLLVLGSSNCTGALELPALNTIVFHIMGEGQEPACFYIKYGDLCLINSLDLNLDIDDGFFIYSGCIGVDEDPESKKIKNILNESFNSWKKNNYTGPLFSSDKQLNFDVKSASLSTRLGGRGFFSSSLSNHYMSYYSDVTSVNKDNVKKVKELLKDYTKDNFFLGGFLGRVFHGTWNRHHLDEVDRIIQDGNHNTVKAILSKLDEIPLENYNGALARRIEYIRTNFVEVENPKTENLI